MQEALGDLLRPGDFKVAVVGKHAHLYDLFHYAKKGQEDDKKDLR